MGAERHRQENEVRQHEAWRLRLQGLTQAKIAEQLGVSQQAVSLLLLKTEKRLHAEFVAQAEEIKARQTAQLEQIYLEAFEQWRRSCEDAEQVTTVTGRAKATNDGCVIDLPDQETRTVKGQSGNPALLEKAMQALENIRSIWGLEAPKKQEFSGPEGGPIRVSEVVVELAKEAED